MNGNEALSIVKRTTKEDGFYAYNTIGDYYIFCKGDPVFWVGINVKTKEVVKINSNEILLAQKVFNKETLFDIEELSDAIRNAKDISELK